MRREHSRETDSHLLRLIAGGFALLAVVFFAGCRLLAGEASERVATPQFSLDSGIYGEDQLIAIKALAAKPGMVESTVSSATYLITYVLWQAIGLRARETSPRTGSGHSALIFLSVR
jgi:hypothetical protein